MTSKITPRIEINLEKIRHNTKVLKKLYGEKGIQISGVVKGVCANLEVARTLVEAGITSLADSKIENIRKMKMAGLKSKLILLRTPALSEVQQVVEFADISMNTELEIIRALSAEAKRQNKIHSIIIMVEMGDLREGILPKDTPAFIREVLRLPGIELAGIGTNFACFGGVVPTVKKMQEFSNLVNEIQKEFQIKLPIVSGGNSANYTWLMNTHDAGSVNNIRLGESILLGRDPVSGKVIPGLYPDAFYFVAEVIESKLKPSVPSGIRGRNAFGERISFEDHGLMRRAIVGVGRQDVLVSGLSPVLPIEIIGSSSDHIILNTKQIHLKPGEEVAFFLNYGALLSVMTSPYVYKTYTRQTSKRYNSLTRTPA
jgi:predicted amino acid racemase